MDIDAVMFDIHDSRLWSTPIFHLNVFTSGIDIKSIAIVAERDSFTIVFYDDIFIVLSENDLWAILIDPNVLTRTRQNYVRILYIDIG